MKTGITLSLIGLILIVSSFAAIADRQGIMESPVWQEKINVDLKDISLGTALEAIIKPTGTSYVIDPDLKFIRIPNVSFNQVPREAALKSVAKAGGAVYRIDGNVLVVSPKPDSANPWIKLVSVDAHNAPLSTVLPEMFKSAGISFTLDPGAANLVVKSVKLKDVSFAEALSKVLEDAGATYSSNNGIIQILPKPVPPAQNSPAKSEVKESYPSNITVTETADNADPWLKRVSIEVKDATLAAVVEALFKNRGFNFSIDQYAGHLIVRSLEMTDVTIREALDRLLKITGAVCRIDNGIVTISAKPPSDAQSKLINLDVKDMPFSELIGLLFKQAGLDYIIDPDIKQSNVTATITNVPFQKALDSLINSTGLASSIDNGVYHISATPSGTDASVPGQSKAKTPKKEIDLYLRVEVKYLDKGPDLWVHTLYLREGCETKMHMVVDATPPSPFSGIPRQPAGEKDVTSILSASMTPTTLKDGSIQISGTIDYTKDDCNARGIKILAVLKPGKAQTLPEIPIPSVKGNTRAVMKLTLTATPVKK